MGLRSKTGWNGCYSHHEVTCPDENSDEMKNANGPIPIDLLQYFIARIKWISQTSIKFVAGYIPTTSPDIASLLPYSSFWQTGPAWVTASGSGPYLSARAMAYPRQQASGNTNDTMTDWCLSWGEIRRLRDMVSWGATQRPSGLGHFRPLLMLHLTRHPPDMSCQAPVQLHRHHVTSSTRSSSVDPNTDDTNFGTKYYFR